MTTEQPPTHITVFGATGDLAARKIFPAIWHLFERDRCPENMAVVGIARRELSQEEFQNIVADAVRAHDASVDDETLSQFLGRFSYQSGDLKDPETYTTLKETIDADEKRWGICANKIMYMAVPQAVYHSVFEGLAEVDLNKPCGGELGWTRILVEKPFGEDLESAERLHDVLTTYFREEQIYRIDHYLFKEIVQGIKNFRFSNNLFESQWNNGLIDSITLRLNETIDVSGRGAFYDAVGALRDVGQNHMLAMLSILTAEYASSANQEHTRALRAELLETLRSWDETKIQQSTMRAQYEGYRENQGVASDSGIETYFALETELDHPRWRGVPIYMEAGKALSEARKEIVLTLKQPSTCFLCEENSLPANKIIFRLEPREEIVIHFWTKKPGFDKELEERTFSFFLYEKENKTQYVEEYAKLLYDAMSDDQSLFVSHEEVRAQWKFVDPIIRGWQDGLVPLSVYKPGETPTPAFFAGKEGLEEAGHRGSVGIVGLGKMGSNLASQLTEKNWHVVGYNKSKEATERLVQEDVITGAFELEKLVDTLQAPRAVWLMVPHSAVDAVLEELVPLLEEGDTVIDGGNSFFKDSIRRARELKERGVHFLDAGISGGPHGAREGACVMIGGEGSVFRKHEQLFRDIAAPNAYQFFEGAGRGHFVKMVHNGIEYGMMQSLAEGFAVMRAHSSDLDLTRVADVYNHRSVIESRLVGWLKEAFEKYGEDLDPASGSVAHTGEGEWTVETANELDVKTPAIKDAFNYRVESKKTPNYTGKILSALRNQFGGHDIDAGSSNDKNK